jgi:Rrf2 family transcriptional regulator, iron-sulfur cluster assembly transcription factor
MLSLSLTTGYAIKALRCLECGGGRAQQITELARGTGVPRPYLAKIIGSLSQHKLVSTKRGYHGGVSLTKPAQDVSLLEVVVAIEGEHWIGNCLLGLKGCESSDECPTLGFWNRIRKEIEQELGRLTLADVIKCRKSEAGVCSSSLASCCFNKANPVAPNRINPACST